MQNQATARRHAAFYAPAQATAIAETIRAATAQVRLARTKRPTGPLTVVKADMQSQLS